MTAYHIAPFWERKGLTELNHQEWEALCDGCGQCCLFKIEDDDTGEIFQTCIACRLLDVETCRCRHYRNRHRLVPQCLKISATGFDKFHLLPESCGYRRINEGRPLPDWHPLLTGDPESVHRADASVRGKVIPEENVPPTQFEDFVID
jgi:uncharacterized protein